MIVLILSLFFYNDIYNIKCFIMDSNQYIIINDNSTIDVNVGAYDVWSLVVIQGNFMLDKYSGRGSINGIKVIGFTNLGDGITGEIEFFVNNKRCYKGGIAEPKGENGYFNVTPKYVTLNGIDTTQFVTVSSDGNWVVTPTETEYFTISTTSNGFTITSKSNDFFENVPITVTNYDGAVEYVYVSQASYVSTDILIVNPKYISLQGENKTFTINVISLCKGNSSYKINGTTYTTNSVTSSITATEDTTFTLNVTNDCDMSETVTIVYKKETENEHYLWVESSGKSSTNCSFSNNDIKTIDVLSSSNWRIKSYDSSYLSCTKSGNKINVSLNQDNLSEFNNKVITLINNDGDIATIVCSSTVKIVNDEIIFTFGDNSTAITATTSADNNYTFTACVYAYKNVNGTKQSISWKNKSSNFKITNGDTQNGGVDSCTNVTFSATTNTQNSLITNYTITLQEQDSYNEIKINVTVDRTSQAPKDGYRITIAPESGTYSTSESDGFTVTVNPIYTYDGFEYYIGNNDTMSGDTNFKGVSAKTSFTNGVSAKTSETLYDSIVYTLYIPEGVTSFKACTTATTKDGTSQTCSDCTACTEITLSAVSETYFCEFRTDVTSIEAGYESTSFTYTFLSTKDGECIEYDDGSTTPTVVSGDTNWRSWLTVDDSDCEVVTYSFAENEDFDERNVILKFKQVDGCSGDEITVSFKQYGNGTLFIPDFDYLVIRYFWESSAGRDLDTVTVIPYFIKSDGSQYTDTSIYSYIGDGVGFGNGYSVSGTDGVYIGHAGDNTQNGNECVYIDFKNMCSEEQIENMLRSGIEKIRVDLYGIWYSTKGTGELDVSLIAYRDGEIIEDPNDEYNYINSGGTEVYNDIKNAKVCAQGSGYASTYQTNYNLIGYVEYNVRTASAMLVLNEECEDSVYTLTNAETSTTITLPYNASTTNTISFNSTKDGNVFTSVSGSQVNACDWLTIGTVEGTTNPLSLSYSVTENTTGAERGCDIKITQGESNKTIQYYIKQSANASTYFSLSNTELKTTSSTTLGSTDTEITLNVYSCKSHNATNNTGIRLAYSETMPCGSTVSKTNTDPYQYTHKINIPTDCGNGTITLIQNETNAQITITFNRECSCAQQTIVNVESAVLSVGVFENDVTSGQYKFPVTCKVTLSEIIECGSATVTINFNTSDNGNACFIMVDVENGSNYGDNTIYCSVQTNQYPDSNCIKEIGVGHDIIFTDSDCYGKGTISVSIERDSMCVDCECEITSVSITPTEYTFTSDTESKIFATNIVTNNCDACTKSYRLKAPNGDIVGTGTGEDTITLLSTSVVDGTYTLESVDDTSVTATLIISKFTPYCVFEIAKVINGVVGNYYTTLTEEYEADDSASHYLQLSIRSKYYSSETESENIEYTMSSNKSWVVVDNINKKWEVYDNDTSEERSATITLTQVSPCSKICYIIINQKGGVANDYYFSFSDTSEVTTSSVTINSSESTFDVTFYSCYGTDYNNGTAKGYTYSALGLSRVTDAVSTNGCETTERFQITTSTSGTITFTQATSNKTLTLNWSKEECIDTDIANVLFSATATWDDTKYDNKNVTISGNSSPHISCSVTFDITASDIGDQYFGISFSINGIGCAIKTVEPSSDTGHLSSGGEDSLGLEYTEISVPVTISDGGFTITGRFNYLDPCQSDRTDGTYSISVYLNEI